MKRDSRFATLFLPVVALVTLAVAGGVDFALHWLELQYDGMFAANEAYVLLGASSVGALVIAVFVVAVAWPAASSTAPTRLAGLLLLLLGLIATFAPLLLALGLLRWFSVQIVNFVGQQFRLVGAFLAVLGVVLVVRRGNEAG